MHSPILMEYPKSFIYEIKENIERVSYEESENYNITKDFLNNLTKKVRDRVFLIDKTRPKMVL